MTSAFFVLWGRTGVMASYHYDRSLFWEKMTMVNKKALELLKSEKVEDFNKWVRDRRNKGKDSLDLDDSNLAGLKLRNVDLRGAHLNGAILRKTDLREANLKHARMRQADLRGADLREADLTDADLRRCKRKDTNLKKAVLKNTQGL